MKLILKRSQSQKRGFFGGGKGMNFTLKAVVELTPEERGLLDTYKADDTIIATYQIRGSGESRDIDITAGRLIQGFESPEDLTFHQLLDLETDIKESTGMFKKLLNIMKTFDGKGEPIIASPAEAMALGFVDKVCELGKAGSAGMKVAVWNT